MDEKQTNTHTGLTQEKSSLRAFFSDISLPFIKNEQKGSTVVIPDTKTARDILTFLVAQLPSGKEQQEYEKEVAGMTMSTQDVAAITFLKLYARIEKTYQASSNKTNTSDFKEKITKTFTAYAGAEFFLTLLTNERFQLAILQEHIVRMLAKKLIETGLPRKKINDLIVQTTGDTILKGVRIQSASIDFSEPETVFLSLPPEWMRLANDALLVLMQGLFVQVKSRSGAEPARSFIEDIIRQFDADMSALSAFHALLRMLPADFISAGYLEEMSKGELEVEVQKRTSELSRNTAHLERLLAENANLIAFPENNPNPILGANHSGALTYHNPATEKLRDALQVNSIEELLPSGHYENIQKALASGESTRDESKHGDRYYEWLYVPFRDAVHMYASDISDKKRIEQLLQEANSAAKLMIKKEQALTKANSNLADLNAELSQVGKELVSRDRALSEANNRLISLDKMKSEFVSVAAHQLRTPLTGIRWTLQSLSDEEFGPLNEKQEEFIKTAHKTVIGAIELINDLLNVARIEEGRFGYSMKDGNIKDIVAQSVERFIPIAKSKGVNLLFEANATVPNTQFDPEKITMAFDNLIDNAIKYTDAGGTVTVGLFADAERIRVAVSDSGIGVPEAEKKKMFIKFFRAGNAQLFHTSGTGLGLYIVKNIVEKHKGSIAFDSVEHKGTTFTITLPISHA